MFLIKRPFSGESVLAVTHGSNKKKKALRRGLRIRRVGAQGERQATNIEKGRKADESKTSSKPKGND
jgi:hypothetical protein